ncbi:putative O-glycosylation ligase, exosortase A system-associated [Sphingomonas sp.]|uniref:putative O-glycosylation ligase, exosortase A system-associated n=1 Tax=Sphingomonas sp. TaxID=28214 RepID=UPI002CD152F7|nr:putative O-glycosylation ligase, exosortase A system-associated [Sphingomonas sp.]HWK36529.1 putative O-glycosylation ligase, exosortase A system-associated [Sphingomonas sp.]
MRDLIFFGFIATLFGIGLKRPFLFVLAYVYIDTLSPQLMMYTALGSIPYSLIAAALALLGFIAADDKRDVRVAPRQIMLLMLLLYCWYTTINADFPVEAQFKWNWVWKAIAFGVFLPLTLRTRLRIEALLLFMLLSVGAIIIVGGIKTLASGGGYGALNLMVANNTGLFEGSIISAVAISVVPILLWFTRHGTIFPPDWRVKLFCYALVFACLLMPIGTSARTGLLCVALLGVLLLRDMRMKTRVLYLSAIAVVGLVAVPFLPSKFTQRMETIKTYQADASASTRIAVWKWTIDYVKSNPMGGGFEAYRQNHIRYDKVAVEGASNNATVERSLEVDRARAYHSAYFEMLGEQGYPGLALWLLIQLAGLARMEILRRRYAKATADDAWIAPLASALQHAHLIYLLGAAFVGIALNPFLFMLIGTQIGFDTYVGRKRSETGWQPMRRQRPQPATA